MANNTLIGAIRAEATLESGKFVDGAKKIRLESKKTETQVKQSFTSMGSSVRGFGGALTTGLSIGLLTGLIKKSLEYANSIGDVAKQLGITTKELQEFRYAAAQVGVDQSAADKGLENLNLTLGKAAQGSTTASKALAAVGVSLEDIRNKSKIEIFGQIADQMQKQGGAAKNAAALNAVFGESYAKMVPLLEQGSAGIDGLRDAAQRLGIVLSDQQIQSADETARKLDDVKRVLAAQVAGVVTENASSIVTLASALGSLTGAIVNFMASNPTAALAILGAMAGGRVGGLPGAALGAVGGAFLGQRMAEGAADGNADVRFRMEKTRQAKAAYENAKRGAKRLGTDREVKRTEAELRRQTALLVSATKNLGAAKPSTGTPDLPQFLAPKPPKTPKGPKPKKGPRDRSDDVEFQFAQELRQSQMDVLRAHQGLAGTSAERTQIALAMLDLDKEMRDAELANRVRMAERDLAEGKITEGAFQEVKAQAEKLQLRNDEANQLQRQAILRDAELDRMERADTLSQRSYEHQLEDLRYADEMADTAAEHRRVQLQIVDTLYKQKEAHLRALKAELLLAGKIDEANDVQDEINRLPTDRAHDEERVRQGTRNPMEEWAASIPQTSDEIIEALQSIEAEGLDHLSDALTDVIMGTKSLKEAFHEVAASVLADLLKMAIKMALMKGLTALFGGGFAGGGYTGDGIGGYGTYAGLVNSGAIPANGAFASGGYTGNRGVNSIAGVVHGREFVINAAATRKYLPLLEAMNSGRLPGMKLGGLAGLPLPRTSYGQRAGISNDNGNFPPPVHQHFDLRGAVMTEDLLRQMNAMSDRAAEKGAKMGADRVFDLNDRTFGRALRR